MPVRRSHTPKSFPAVDNTFQVNLLIAQLTHCLGKLLQHFKALRISAERRFDECRFSDLLLSPNVA